MLNWMKKVANGAYQSLSSNNNRASGRNRLAFVSKSLSYVVLTYEAWTNRELPVVNAGMTAYFMIDALVARKDMKLHLTNEQLQMLQESPEYVYLKTAEGGVYAVSVITIAYMLTMASIMLLSDGDWGHDKYGIVALTFNIVTLLGQDALKTAYRYMETLYNSMENINEPLAEESDHIDNDGNNLTDEKTDQPAINAPYSGDNYNRSAMFKQTTQTSDHDDNETAAQNDNKIDNNIASSIVMVPTMNTSSVN